MNSGAKGNSMTAGPIGRQAEGLLPSGAVQGCQDSFSRSGAAPDSLPISPPWVAASLITRLEVKVLA